MDERHSRSRRRAAPALPPLDLNLLWTLDVLLEEKSVRAAAARLGVTPSAVSHALARLREALGDELLVRSGRSMVPTARGLALAESLHGFTDVVRQLAAHGEPFDPKTSERRFVIATTDHIALALVPNMIDRMREQGARATLTVRPLAAEPPFTALAQGEVDLAIGVMRASPVPAGFRTQTLYRERLVCVLRRGHPALASKLSTTKYAELDHILVAPRGSANRGTVDDALERIGKKRRIALVLAHHLVAPFVLAQSDLVMTVSRRIAQTFARYLPLEIVPAPVPLEPYDIDQLWHDRAQKDEAHGWLRRLVLASARAMRE
jgi:DNA-binding transcriptional LysR family regulator